MVQLRTTLEEATKNWVENSIRRNPERIRGIALAYFQGRQSLKWAVGLLKTENEKLVNWAVSPYREKYPEKYAQITSAIEQAKQKVEEMIEK